MPRRAKKTDDRTVMIVTEGENRGQYAVFESYVKVNRLLESQGEFIEVTLVNADNSRAKRTFNKMQVEQAYPKA